MSLAHVLAAQAPALPADPPLGSAETVLFWILAPLMVIASLGLLFVKKAVHAAVLVAFTMICLAVMYAAQDAQFLFAAQIVVYTGAVMMLFLFVLMLVGVDSADSLVETIKGQRWVGLLTGFAIFVVVGGGITGYAFSIVDWTIRLPFGAEPRRLGEPAGREAANADGNPVGVAREVFGRYVFAFEVVATLLVIAALGAILLTHRERLTARPSQASLARDRVRQGTQVPPLPAPGVFARSNAVDAPALLPDGTPAEESVARVLAARGTVRSAPALADDITEVQRTLEDVDGGPAGGATGGTDRASGSGHNTENPEAGA